MREARPPIPPRLHVFVCANRRDPSSPLGTGCAERGDAVYDALKAGVAQVPGGVTRIWITKTHCLGVCPKRGATVARYGRAGDLGPPGPILTEVEPADAPALLQTARVPDAIAHEVDQLEALQRGKVLALARRLKPGLTLEDVQNPHDFPELDDADWHYADGVLAGIASVKAMMRSRNGEEEEG